MGSRWTQADITRRELARKGRQPAPSKYRNVKVLIDGERFDSKHEADYYQGLMLRQRAGEIHELQRQVRFPLYAPEMADDIGAAHTGRAVMVAEYMADYIYRDVGTERLHVVDAKGQTRRACPYPLKKKWLELQQGIIIEEV